MVATDEDIDNMIMLLNTVSELLPENMGSFIIYYRAYFDPEYLIENPLAP